jgi:hypothetical protein
VGECVGGEELEVVGGDEGVEAFLESVLLGENGEGMQPVDVVGCVGGDVGGC